MCLLLFPNIILFHEDGMAVLYILSHLQSSLYSVAIAPETNIQINDGVLKYMAAGIPLKQEDPQKCLCLPFLMGGMPKGFRLSQRLPPFCRSCSLLMFQKANLTRETWEKILMLS